MFQNEEEQNLYLIYKYLLEVGFDESEANKLIVENSANLFGAKGLAYQLGKMSLEFFCMYFLQDTFLPKEDNAAAPIAKVHEEIWQDIQESIIGDGNNQIGRILPRGTGKSAFGTFAATIWAHAYKFKIYTLICSDIGSTAEKFIKDIKNTFLENKYIEKAFGVLLDDKDKKYVCNSTQLELTNKTFIEAISSVSSIRGRKYGNNRPDLIILDDFQSIEDCRTDEAREKKWLRFSNDIKYAVQKSVVRNGKTIKKGTTLLALGTLQHKEDFYSRLIKQPTWKFKIQKGVLIDDFINEDGQKVNGLDHYFNSDFWLEFKNILFNFKNETHLEDAKEFYWNHESEMQYPLLWGEFWDCLDYALSYYENPTSFKQEVQSDVDSIGEKWFKTVRTQTKDEIEGHTFVKNMIVCDPASSVSNKADYTAICVGSTSNNDMIYIRKGILTRLSFDDFCNKVIELLKIYTDVTHVDIEKNLYMGADVSKIQELISKEHELSNRNIEFINNMQKKNKDEKISTIITSINRGQIIFNEDDEDFINQILDFRGQRFSIHDDAPDCVSQLTIDIKKIVVVQCATFFDRRLLGL